MSDRDFALDVVRKLQQAGYETLWAGGCVRDELLGLTPKDYDVATSARPEEVQKLFRRTIAVGMSFGVMQVMGPRHEGRFLQVEVATFRCDGAYTDGRHPDEVTFSTAEEDAQRRDFTINGMFKNPVTDEIIDYVGGREDLKDKVLRAIGDPFQRIQEDKLRMLRAVRMATRFGFQIELKTADAIRQMASQIEVVSPERIADELRKMLAHPARALAVQCLKDLDLLAAIIPEAPRDDSIFKTLSLLPSDASATLTLATLLHSQSPQLVDSICLRFRLSNEEREHIVWLVENQRTIDNASAMRTCDLKRLLIEAGILDLLTMSRVIGLVNSEQIEICESRLREWGESDLNPPPLLSGHDLMSEGLEPGPIFKELLDLVRDEQLDGTISTREEALSLIRARVDQ